MTTMSLPAPTPRALIDRPVPAIQPQTSADDRIPKPLAQILDTCWKNIRRDVVVPLLHAQGVDTVFQENWDLYMRWSHVASDAVINVLSKEEILRLADEVTMAAREYFADQGSELLDPTAIKALLGGLQLKDMVRQAVAGADNDDGIPEEALEEISKLVPLLAAHELCLLSVREYLDSRNKQFRENAHVLAQWSFHYADRAYAEWGFIELDLGHSSPFTAE